MKINCIKLRLTYFIAVFIIIFVKCTKSKEQLTNNENGNYRISITFPGTKWCGPADTASSYEDLGRYTEEDKCCRAHDNCDNIPGKEEKYGLKNEDYFTRLHCKCDKAFFQCLHNIDSNVSNIIGKQYFLLRNKCYKEEYPIIKCTEYVKGIYVRRCNKYDLDKTKNKKYQWFDLPLYGSESFPTRRTNNSDADYYDNLCT